MDRNEELAKKAIKALRAKCFSSDIEACHGDADQIICALLYRLGYKDVVDVYNEVEKWYA